MKHDIDRHFDEERQAREQMEIDLTRLVDAKVTELMDQVDVIRRDKGTIELEEELSNDVPALQD